MVLLTPRPIKQIYGLKEWDGPSWGQSRKATPVKDAWDNLQGLVLWFTDNGKGASVWQDSSGAGNNGTVYGAGTAPTATPGELGYSFDGVDDYIDAGNGASLNLSNVTVSCWFNLSSDNLGGICGKWASNKGFLLFMQAANTLRFQMDSTSNIVATTTIKNTWIHAAGTFNGSNMILYKNGLYVGTDTATHTQSAQPLWIGHYSTVYLNGIINDVRIYSRALGQAEITSYFQHTRGKYGV